MSFKVLLIGLGQIGMGYDLHLDTSYVYSHARAFSLHTGFALIAGVDVNPISRQCFEERYHCPAYENVDEALKDHQPDVIVLAVPTLMHGEVLQQVLKHAAPRLILCEKPLSYSFHEAELIVQACAERNILLYVNYMRRSEPGVQEIKRRLDKGEISAPLKGVVWYSKGFLHNGSHFFNLMTYWLGEFVSSKLLTPGRRWGEHDQEPDVQVIFERGSVIFFAAWEEAFSHYTVELLSPSGRLRYENEGERITWEKTASDPSFQGYTVLSDIEMIESGMKQYQWHVVCELLKALEDQGAHLCSGKDALYTLKTMQQVMN